MFLAAANVKAPDCFVFQITQEQFILASQSLHLHRPGGVAVYPVGLYGWRKRCLYFLLLLLLVTMIVNLALTVWIDHKGYEFLSGECYYIYIYSISVMNGLLSSCSLLRIRTTVVKLYPVYAINVYLHSHLIAPLFLIVQII